MLEDGVAARHRRQRTDRVQRTRQAAQVQGIVAQALGKDLEAARVALEQALKEWEVANEETD